jgi:hypothetical protein
VKDEVAFLADLHAELAETFGEDLATALFGAAAAEFFAGPAGVTAMWERGRQQGKTIPDHLRKMPK